MIIQAIGFPLPKQSHAIRTGAKTNHRFFGFHANKKELTDTYNQLALFIWINVISVAKTLPQECLKARKTA